MAQKTVGVLVSEPNSVYNLSASVPIMKSPKFYFALSIFSDIWVEAPAKLFSFRTKPLTFYSYYWLACYTYFDILIAYSYILCFASKAFLSCSSVCLFSYCLFVSAYISLCFCCALIYYYLLCLSFYYC